MNKLPTILLWNLLGAVVALSWIFLPGHGLWARWDVSIFQTFNALIAEPGPWRTFMAVTNHRLFDLVSLGCMLALLASCFVQGDGPVRARWVAIGLWMMLVALLLNRIGHLLPVERPSPTISLSWALRLTELTDFPTKDSSSDSFPGDHGMMLMVFAAFMLRFAPRWMGLLACLMVPVFTLPRMMVGAHWFTDIYMGSLAVVTLVIPWLLLTPVSDKVVSGLSAWLLRQSWLQRWL